MIHPGNGDQFACDTRRPSASRRRRHPRRRTSRAHRRRPTPAAGRPGLRAAPAPRIRAQTDIRGSRPRYAVQPNRLDAGVHIEPAAACVVLAQARCGRRASGTPAPARAMGCPRRGCAARPRRQVRHRHWPPYTAMRSASMPSSSAFDASIAARPCNRRARRGTDFRVPAGNPARPRRRRDPLQTSARFRTPRIAASPTTSRRRVSRARRAVVRRLLRRGVITTTLTAGSPTRCCVTRDATAPGWRGNPRVQAEERKCRRRPSAGGKAGASGSEDPAHTAAIASAFGHITSYASAADAAADSADGFFHARSLSLRCRAAGRRRSRCGHRCGMRRRPGRPRAARCRRRSPAAPSARAGCGPTSRP